MNSIFSYIVIGLLKLLSLLPLRVLYFFSDFTFLIIYYLIGYRRKLSFNQLKKAFPKKSNNELKNIHRKFYRHFCDLIFETIRTHSMGKKEIMKRCKFINPEVISHYYKTGKSVCVATGHYGNWEWTNSLNFYTELITLPIYKPLRNKVFDRFLYKTRSKFGSVPVPKNDIVRQMLKFKVDKKQTITAFINDQSPKPADIKFWTKFLNQDTPVFLGIEKIAQKLKQSVVFAKMRKVKRGYYETEFVKICDDASKTKEFEITKAHTKLLEELIIEEPAYWLWTHKRWKHKRKNIESQRKEKP